MIRNMLAFFEKIYGAIDQNMRDEVTLLLTSQKGLLKP